MTKLVLPKRLIEVELPIKRISAHARREKAIRHGHISTLHMWWARRPLAACRAVICAALWPDPADVLCPEAFKEVARDRLRAWARQHLRRASAESVPLLIAIQKDPTQLDDPLILRRALLNFIADFANWDNSTVREYLDISRALTQTAHETLGGTPGTRPLVTDPFAGGGAIPLEALRVGADAFASDLNPVAVLLNKVVLEYLPKYGTRLADAVQKWGGWIRKEAERELAEFYPRDPDGSTPIAYLWARTIQCEGPGCGAEIPLMNQTQISKRRGVGVKFVVNGTTIQTEVETDKRGGAFGHGTVKNGKITCPACGFTISADRYRRRAREGALGEAIYCTVLSKPDGLRRYRNPSLEDKRAFRAAKECLNLFVADPTAQQAPAEKLSATEPRRLNVLHYGFDNWGMLFNDRQKLFWSSITRLLSRVVAEIKREEGGEEFAEAVASVLGLTASNVIQYNCNMSTWLSDGMISVFIQSSSIPMRADYAEANPLMEKLVGGLQYQLERTDEALRAMIGAFDVPGAVALSSATRQILPEESVDLLATDPPYYFAIPYAELSDFFYVWLRRFLEATHPHLLKREVTPKEEEAIQNLPHSQAVGQKDRAHFEEQIFRSLVTGREELKQTGVGLIVFAHASTEGWESLLKSLLKAGWMVTASWPIDTEKEGRMLASRQRALASSVHLVCRPRMGGGASPEQNIGDWRDVLGELPRRIHDWMPRLAEEGVVGADAIFACLGPALEIFSRYSRVEKASGEVVTLKEYLEQVWAAVAKEALSLVFEGADTAGFEPDARLTAMWLWTLNAGASADAASADDSESDATGDEESASKSKPKGGFTLEYDAARKIAQGLGAHLEELSHLVEIKGDQARLLPAAERTKHLFGKEEAQAPTRGRGKKKPVQGDLFADLKEAEEETGWGATGAPKAGETVLDRIHQSMILFAAGRGEALKRFLVEEGAGRDQRFWSLAQALSALYPTTTDEKRWVDGVLARKKSLGY